MPSSLLGPVVALAAWTHLAWLLMYITRLPAMRKASIKPDPTAPRGAQMAQLPPRVRWKADNYNHLMEQPTVFYAVALVLAVAGGGEGLNVALAWAYVGARVVHSLVQGFLGNIELRFMVFVVSGILLIYLTVNAALLIS